MVVIAQKNQITYNNWTGTGYIVLDPDTGAGAYMISGGLSGGSTTDTSGWKVIKWVLQGFLALMAILHAGGAIELGVVAALLLKLVPFLTIALECYLLIKQVENANISPETKRMITGYIIAFGALAATLALIAMITAPWGVGIAYLVSMYVVIALEAVLTMIYFAERVENYPAIE
jgi:hypothetical protein